MNLNYNYYDYKFNYKYNKFVILTFLIMLLLCSCFFCVKGIKPDIFIEGCNTDNCSSNYCYGRNCKTGICKGLNCISGDCIGENCQAGDCIGKNCIAGNCYGYGCIPGKCIDPECDPNVCPQINKQCQDGKSYRINRPFYYGISKYLFNDTIVNPPICNNIITFKDIKDGKIEDLDILSINILNKGSLPYSQINNPELENLLNIRDNDIITKTYPHIFKNDNCDICTSKKCQTFKFTKKYLI